jgi:hypothetical protein
MGQGYLIDLPLKTKHWAESSIVLSLFMAKGLFDTRYVAICRARTSACSVLLTMNSMEEIRHKT